MRKQQQNKERKKSWDNLSYPTTYNTFKVTRMPSEYPTTFNTFKVTRMQSEISNDIQYVQGHPNAKWNIQRHSISSRSPECQVKIKETPVIWHILEYYAKHYGLCQDKVYMFIYEKRLKLNQIYFPNLLQRYIWYTLVHK